MKRPRKKLKTTNPTPMAKKDDSISTREIIEIDDYSISPTGNKTTPLRPILCLKNRDQVNKYEEKDDCFILEFDPYNELDISTLSCSNNSDADFCVIAEKGQVACRDYPHPRSTCVKFPFNTTPHDSHCDMCYCYVCDEAAPCKKWAGSHCHAFNNEAWNNEKKVQRQVMKMKKSISLNHKV